MRRKTSFVNRRTQRLPMPRIEDAAQVHDHVLLAKLHLIAYVLLEEPANVERLLRDVVMRTLDVPVLPCRIGTVASPCKPDDRLGQLASLDQCKNHVGFLQRTAVNTTTLVGISC